MQFDGQGVLTFDQKTNKVKVEHWRNSSCIENRFVIRREVLVPRDERSCNSGIASCNFSAIQIGHESIIIVHEEIDVQPGVEILNLKRMAQVERRGGGDYCGVISIAVTKAGWSLEP